MEKHWVIKVAEVPLIIGINWVLMVYGGIALARSPDLEEFSASLLAAVIMTSSDVFIEKFAILSDMWSWQNTEPPLQNYHQLADFLFHFLFACLPVHCRENQERWPSMDISINWLCFS